MTKKVYTKLYTFFSDNMKERLKGILYLGIIILIITVLFNYLDSKNIFENNDKFIKVLNNNLDYSYLNDKDYIIKKISMKNIINYNYSNIYFKTNENITPIVMKEEIKDDEVKNENLNDKKLKEKPKTEKNAPIVYIYTTHQTEEYYFKSNAPYNITPTVMNTAYMLKEKLSEYGIESIVEERSIPKILKKNNWNYSYSYKASRIYLEDIVLKYPTLNYFIDVHRDSVKKDITTLKYKNDNYARVLFISGLENKDYKKNLKMIEALNISINKTIPNLSRGIYKKKGKGVNGIYNQDFSPNCILIEFGGVKNTIEEVYNTVNIVGKELSKYIGDENENK